ncbi:MAG: hypothetical protein ACUVXI_10770 [bacterium]
MDNTIETSRIACFDVGGIKLGVDVSEAEELFSLARSGDGHTLGSLLSGGAPPPEGGGAVELLKFVASIIKLGFKSHSPKDHMPIRYKGLTKLGEESGGYGGGGVAPTHKGRKVRDYALLSLPSSIRNTIKDIIPLTSGPLIVLNLENLIALPERIDLRDLYNEINENFIYISTRAEAESSGVPGGSDAEAPRFKRQSTRSLSDIFRELDASIDEGLRAIDNIRVRIGISDVEEPLEEAALKRRGMGEDVEALTKEIDLDSVERAGFEAPPMPGLDVKVAPKELAAGAEIEVEGEAAVELPIEGAPTPEEDVAGLIEEEEREPEIAAPQPLSVGEVIEKEEETYDISDEVDRQEVYRQIEDQIRSSRAGRAETPHIEGRRRGAALPLAVNVGAILILILGVLAFNFVSQRETHRLSIRGGPTIGVESEIIRETQKRAREEIEAQQAKLAEVEAEIVRLESERNNWIKEQEGVLARREAALRKEHQDRLQKEVERIRSEGGPNVEARIAAARSASEKELRDAISQAHAEAEAAKAEYQRQLEISRTQLEQERSSYQVAIANTQAKLEAEQAKTRAAQKRISELETQNRALMEAQENSRAFRRQVNLLYNKAIEDYQAQRYESAKAGFNRVLEQLGKAPQLNLDEATKEASETQSLMVNSVISLVSLVESINAARDDAEIKRLKKVMGEIDALYEKANTAYEASDYSAAQENYRKVIGTISQVSSADNRLREIEKRLIDGQARRRLAKAQKMVDDKNYEAAKGEYESIILTFPTSSYIKDAVAGLSRVNDILGEKKIEVARIAADEQTKERLAQARILSERGEHEAAKREYEAIILEFPNSSYIEEAVAGLNEVNGILFQNMEARNLEAKKEEANRRAQTILADARIAELSGDYETAKRHYEQLILSASDSDYISNALQGINRMNEKLVPPPQVVYVPQEPAPSEVDEAPSPADEAPRVEVVPAKKREENLDTDRRSPWGRIVQLLGNTAYFDPQRAAGIREGMEFTVHRRTEGGLMPIGIIRVTDTSGVLIEAEILDAQTSLKVGDVIELNLEGRPSSWRRPNPPENRIQNSLLRDPLPISLSKA